jgi:hypothetical protein
VSARRAGSGVPYLWSRQRCSYVKAGPGFEGVEDDAGELAFEAADRFAAALAFGLFAFEVGARGRMDACLGDSDPVEGGVELAVAAAGEAVALDAT